MMYTPGTHSISTSGVVVSVSCVLEVSIMYTPGSQSIPSPRANISICVLNALS